MTTAGPLPDVPDWALKLLRAEAHLVAMDIELAAWRNDESYRIVFEPQPDPTHYLVRAEQAKPVPASFSLIIGDAVQCLRTGLDQLTWRLTNDWLDGAAPTHPTSVEFPIFKEEIRFNDRGMRAIAEIHPDAQQIITDLQPFKSGNNYALSPLWRLHELNNRDKHRNLTLTAVTGEVTRITVEGVVNMIMGGLIAGPGPGQRLDQNPVLGFVPILPGLPDPAKVNSQTEMALDVAISEPDFPLLEWSAFFRSLNDWLWASIFQPLFPFLGVKRQ